jgi:hypothetical protein
MIKILVSKLLNFQIVPEINRVKTEHVSKLSDEIPVDDKIYTGCSFL